MELAIIAGVGLIGSYIVNNKDTKSTNTLTDTDIKNDIKYIESIDNNLDYTDNIKLFPNQIDAKVHHLYDTRIVPELDKKYYDMAKDQREKSKIPERTNIIPPFYNQPYQNEMTRMSDNLVMGPVPSSELLKSSENQIESFTSQFDLATADNTGEPASMGDAWKSSHRENIINLERKLATANGFSPFENNTVDMTYGITSNEKFTHNNMQASTAQRDLGVRESNNFEYQMEIFTGSSKNWNPKRETVPFYDPEEFKQIPFQTPLATDLQRDRIIVSKIKQNERPFEPVTVVPGLNIGYNDMPKEGPHDTYRVVFKNTNELRTANKPKLTYDGKIAGAPKKGEKRGVTAPVIQRRPDQWRYQTGDEFVPNRAVNTGQTPQGNFIIPDNARMANNCELKGPIVGTTRVGGADREGKVKITKRVTHVEDKLGPKTTERFNNNLNSYNILNNQRNNANYNDVMPGKNTNQGNIAFDRNDIAKPTNKQLLTEKQFNTNQGTTQKNPIKYDSNDIAKPTNKQMLTEREFNTNQGTTQKNPIKYDPNDTAKTTNRQLLTEKQFNTAARQLVGAYSNLTDQAKMTIKQILATQTYEQIMSSAQHNVYSNLSDSAKNTLRQVLSLCETNTMMKTNPGANATPQDIANTTLKQILTSLELNNNMGANQKNPYANQTDMAKNTLRQDLSNAEFNTNVGAAQKETFTNLQDNARNTTRQTLTEAEFNTFVSRAMNSYSNLSDQAKNTIKQILSTQQLNTMLGMTQKQSYANISDDIKATIRQLLTLQTFSTHIRQNIGSYSNITDEIKTTLKELLDTVEYNNNVKSAQQGTYSDLMDLAKVTIKEFIATTELNNNMKANNGQTTVQFSQDARPTHKQDLLNENYVSHMNNPNSGVQQTSFDIQMTMKDLNKAIDYKSAAYASGFSQNPSSQHAERNMRQNIAKEVIAKGVYPTLSGPKLIPTKDNYNSMKQNNKPNYSRSNAPTLTTKINLEDRQIFNVQEVRDKVYYDDRLFQELLDQFDSNPLINNIQTTVDGKQKQKDNNISSSFGIPSKIINVKI